MQSTAFGNYYLDQAGSGIGGFRGARFQNGKGWFGNVLKSAILPVLKYFGKQALVTGTDIARDALEGENVLDSLKARGKMAARKIAGDAADRVKTYAQTGKGRRRRKKNILGIIKTAVKRKRRVKRKKTVRKSRKRGRKRGRKSVKSISSIFN